MAASSSSSSFSAFASLSKRFLSRTPALFLPRALVVPPAVRFWSTLITSDEEPVLEGAAPGPDETPSPYSAAGENPQQRPSFRRPLENGLDPGVFKAILVGKVGQQPVQKYLRTGRTVVLFSLGTGGMRNNRRPLDNEEPRDYAERCAVQWHRVSVYPDALGSLVLKHVKPGSILYLEGNLETKVFSDPVSGLVRRLREIALRGDGRVVFLNNPSQAAEAEAETLKGVGYY